MEIAADLEFMRVSGRPEWAESSRQYWPGGSVGRERGAGRTVGHLVPWSNGCRFLDFSILVVSSRRGPDTGAARTSPGLRSRWRRSSLCTGAACHRLRSLPSCMESHSGKSMRRWPITSSTRGTIDSLIAAEDLAFERATADHDGHGAGCSCGSTSTTT